ncbi:MAG: DUF58 domain-containing protein [Burkholderiales bacterium]|nr:DUF58 domain-containing protein [Burkholderiales bacterium]
MRAFLYRVYRALAALVRWSRRTFTPAGTLALAALVLTGVFGIDTTQSTAYRLFAFLAVLLAVALVGARFARGRFAVRRELPRLVSAGEPFTYRLVLANRGARPARALSIIDDLHEDAPALAQFSGRWRVPTYRRWQALAARNRAGRVDVHAWAALAPGAVVELPMQGRALRRGRLRFTGVSIGCDEPLGLARGIVRVPLEASLTVLPQRYRLPPVHLPGGRRLQQGGVALASSVGDSEEFIGLRDYRPGDMLQRVHWKSFARTGRPVVREYQDEYFERHALVLDTFAGAGDDAAFEEAVAVAASFACTIDTQECLLDLMFVGTEAHTYTAGRGLLSAGSLLEVLAGVRRCEDQPFRVLAEALRARAGGMTGCICVLVGWDRDRADLVDALRARGAAVRVLCVAAARPAAAPSWVTHLVPGRIQEGLAAL